MISCFLISSFILHTNCLFLVICLSSFVEKNWTWKKAPLLCNLWFVASRNPNKTGSNFMKKSCIFNYLCRNIIILVEWINEIYIQSWALGYWMCEYDPCSVLTHHCDIFFSLLALELHGISKFSRRIESAW